MSGDERVVSGAEDVYHFELRAFPHNLCRYNLSAGELRATLLAPWVQDRVFELGERSWDPRRAKLAVLRGPRLDSGELTMGRGWRLAQRRGRDVTEAVLAEARAAGPDAASAPDLAADSLGLELLAAIGAGQVPLGRAWALAQERSPGSAASASLALAERAVASLLRAGLIVLLRRESAGGELREVGRDEVAGALGAVESWTADTIALRRA